MRVEKSPAIFPVDRTPNKYGIKLRSQMTFILCHEYFFSSYLLLPPILIHLRHKTQICYKKKINNIKMAVRFIIDFAVVLNNVNAFFSDFLFINFPRRIREIVARSEHNLSKGGRVARERDCSG